MLCRPEGEKLRDVGAACPLKDNRLLAFEKVLLLVDVGTAGAGLV